MPQETETVVRLEADVAGPGGGYMNSADAVAADASASDGLLDVSVPIVCVPSTEICDGFDNDCDGVVDNVDAVTCCAAGEPDYPCNGCPVATNVPNGWTCIPPGSFTMGNSADEPGRHGDGREQPPHTVTITRQFVIMTTELTQNQWRSVVGTTPSLNEGRDDGCPQCPVEGVTWWDVLAFANLFSERVNLPPCYGLVGCVGFPGDGLECESTVRFEGLDCGGFRLPTEAEWEYAARAGSETLFWSGDTLEDLARAGWFQGNGAVDGQIQTHPVAQKAANSWGLFDVHGNVWEWVHDGYGPYPDAAQVDPLGPRASNQRVIRGGDVFDDLTGTRSAARAGFPHGGSRGGIGFRLIFP